MKHTTLVLVTIAIFAYLATAATHADAPTFVSPPPEFERMTVTHTYRLLAVGRAWQETPDVIGWTDPMPPDEPADLVASHGGAK